MTDKRLKGVVEKALISCFSAWDKVLWHAFNPESLLRIKKVILVLAE
jgi:hypothetical protein